MIDFSAPPYFIPIPKALSHTYRWGKVYGRPYMYSTRSNLLYSPSAAATLINTWNLNKGA